MEQTQNIQNTEKKEEGSGLLDFFMVGLLVIGLMFGFNMGDVPHD